MYLNLSCTDWYSDKSKQTKEIHDSFKFMMKSDALCRSVHVSDIAVRSRWCCTWVLCSYKPQKSSQIQHVCSSPAVLLCTQSFLICDLCFVCCSHRCVLLSSHLIITLRLLNLSFWLHNWLSLFLRFPLLFSTLFLLLCLFVFFLFSPPSFLLCRLEND